MRPILQETPTMHFARSICRRHTLHLLTQRPPIIRLQLRVLDTLLTPFLMQPGDMVLALLKVRQLVADALLDEDAAGVLLDDRFLVLL
jgi:hypothetical protein